MCVCVYVCTCVRACMFAFCLVGLDLRSTIGDVLLSGNREQVICMLLPILECGSERAALRQQPAGAS